MAEPYLIAHLVRGEPAFDVAIRLQIGDEEGWIIPTSGHRAYPFAEWSLCEIELSGYPTTYVIDLMPKEVPPSWPDHYPTRATPTAQAAFAEALGLAPKPLIITRR